METIRLNGWRKLAIIVPICIFTVGLVFAAGINYQKTESLNTEFDSHLVKADGGFSRLVVVEQNQAVMINEIAKMNEVLREIRQELKEMNKRQRK